MRALIIFFVALIGFCQPHTSFAQAETHMVLPHVLVFKLKKPAYRKYVTVELSEDKKTVVSFPDPADLKTGSGYPLPVLLHKGYLLDKRGVSKNTAYIRMTYQQYSTLKAPPTPAQLYRLIIDKQPFIALYDCGARNAKVNSEKQLNYLVDHNLLNKTFTVIK